VHRDGDCGTLIATFLPPTPWIVILGIAISNASISMYLRRCTAAAAAVLKRKVGNGAPHVKDNTVGATTITKWKRDMLHAKEACMKRGMSHAKEACKRDMSHAKEACMKRDMSHAKETCGMQHVAVVSAM
jgi:hypothetical protein